MRILVLGGTGAMGVHLVQLLSNKNIDTYVTSRAKHSSHKNISFIQGNAHDLNFLKTLLVERWDAIVDFMVYNTIEFKKRISFLLNSTSHYLFLSSARVYADSLNPITEDTPRLLDVSDDSNFMSTDEYSLTKARQENMLQDARQRNWTIIRPYITYDTNRLQLGVLEKEEWLYRALNGKTIIFSADMACKRTTMTYGMDVSNAIAALIGEEKAFGERFHIATHESMTWQEILSIYMLVFEKTIGFRPKVKMLDLDNFLICKPAPYQIKYDRLFNRQFDNRKILNFDNTLTFKKLPETLEKSLNTFLKSKQFKNINWRNEGLKDRFSKEHSHLKEILGIKPKIKYFYYRYGVTLKSNITS